MQFKELRMKVEGIGFEKVRSNTDDFFEAFLPVDKLPDLISVLETLLGPPAIPNRKGVSPAVQQIVEEYGGIWAGQTFYYQAQEDRSLFAMLWPWADKEHITLKLGQK